jgi:glycerol-3-phosphate dehydrogenase
MPTLLPNGVRVVNLTPHELRFTFEDGVVVAPSDGVLNALPVNQTVETNQAYSLTEVVFEPMGEGWQLIRRMQQKHPNALLVGSSIAAQAYRGVVVSPVPAYKGTTYAYKRQRLVRPDLFTTYSKQDLTKKETNNHG